MVDSSFLLVLRSNGIADSEPDLGARLMRSFLQQLLEAERLPGKIILLGTGIFLSTEASPVLDLLERLVAAGCDLASCITCLDYYGRREKLKVGRVSNMKETVQAMVAAGKVVTP